ncbi:MAG: hypothetical protein OWV35_08240 [Firmicutes bacterium]|nr:hypothetical protein [Bacillota bacterium]
MALHRLATLPALATCIECGEPLTRNDVLETGQAKRCIPCHREHSRKRERYLVKVAVAEP